MGFFLCDREGGFTASIMYSRIWLGFVSIVLWKSSSTPMERSSRRRTSFHDWQNAPSCGTSEAMGCAAFHSPPSRAVPTFSICAAVVPTSCRIRWSRAQNTYENEKLPTCGQLSSEKAWSSLT